MGMRVETNEANDTFEDHTPIELEKKEEGVDSFDDKTPIEPPKKDEVDKNSQVNQIDNKEDDDEKKKEEKGPEKKEDKEPEDKKDDKGDEEKKEEKAPVVGKKIRIKDAEGNSTDIDASSTIAVKVNGKKEFVSLKELREDYSGRKGHDVQFAELKERSEKVQAQSEKTTQERDEVMGHLNKIAEMLDGDDPMAPLLYLVDISGRNVHDYTKKVFDHQSQTVRDLDEMDDTERQLYWRDRELSYLKSNQATKNDLAQREKSQEEHVVSVNRLRQAQGVSEDSYVEAHESLTKMGYKAEQMTPEAIVKYAAMTPHYDKAEGLCEPFDADLSTDQMDKLVDTVAQTLHNYPGVSEENAIEISVKLLGWESESDDSDLDELEGKGGKRQEAQNPDHKVGKNAENDVESFDDFDAVTYSSRFD